MIYFRQARHMPADQFFNRLYELGWTGLSIPGGGTIGYIPPGNTEAVPLLTLLAVSQATQLTWSARFWLWVWSWA